MSKLKPSNSTLFLSLFLLFSLANLMALSTSNTIDNIITKPFLMIWLWLYAYVRQLANPSTTSRWLLVGLLFSFGGDTLLLFADDRPAGGNFFMLGLGSFLLTHIAYWMAFHYWPRTKSGLRTASAIWSVPFALIWSLMIFVLWPKLPDMMRIPVLVYSVVIMLMAAKAVYISPNLDFKSRQLLISGAILFILSDSIIALSKFTEYLPLDAIQTSYLIMLTYLAGQWLIVKGVLDGLMKERV